MSTTFPNVKKGLKLIGAALIVTLVSSLLYLLSVYLGTNKEGDITGTWAIFWRISYFVLLACDIAFLVGMFIASKDETFSFKNAFYEEISQIFFTLVAILLAFIPGNFCRFLSSIILAFVTVGQMFITTQLISGCYEVTQKFAGFCRVGIILTFVMFFVEIIAKNYVVVLAALGDKAESVSSSGFMVGFLIFAILAELFCYLFSAIYVFKTEKALN